MLGAAIIKSISNNVDFITNISTIPFWTDGCEHGEDTYICSFIVERCHTDKIYKTKFDLYIFPNLHEQFLCLRSGEGVENYLSYGSLTDFIINHKHGHGLNRDIAVLLYSIGKFKFKLMGGVA